MERSATVVWKGLLKEGTGHVTTKSRAIREVSYTYSTRFKDEIGTNPEELIAAAHASCFSMALAGALEKEGLKSIELHTTATVSLQNKNEEWTVSTSHLEVGAIIPQLSDEKFTAIAEKTLQTCPISRLLKAELSVHAKLWTKEKHTEKHSTRVLPGEL